ncbi:MAG: FG-GAP repeat protein [Phycisphaerales bacterium]|nr:FG-GAP repeat protein [Phycisphaerales bacterium]
MNIFRCRTAVLAGCIGAGFTVFSGPAFAGPALAQPCSPDEVTKLLASDGATADSFGNSVSVSGDVAVIGARYDGDNGDFSGSAYVYRFDGTNWVEESKLLASDGAEFDGFGWSVSVSGEVAVIGAYWNDDNGSNSGSAYVYRYDGTNWVEESKLLASDGARDDYFGHSVSVSGNVAVIGAYGDDDNDNGGASGSAYVYRYDGTNWVEESKLLASDAAAGDSFGRSVSVSGEVAVIGAYGNDDNGTSSGSAYVYRFDGTNWVEESKLLASDAATNDYFGWSVSVSGEIAVIGAPGDDDNGAWSGSAYVYRFDGTNWVEESKLLASDGTVNDEFGRSVSVSGDVAVIGAWRDGDNGFDSGSAYVYRYDGTNWVEESKLLASDGAAFDYFGVSVSVSGDVAMIGARGDDDNGGGSGSAYVFELNCMAPCPADLNGDGVLDFFDVSAFLTAYGNQDLIADFTGDGAWDFFDISAFLTAFGAGCP